MAVAGKTSTFNGTVDEIESKSNKVEFISRASGAEKYPNAKAVLDFFETERQTLLSPEDKTEWIFDGGDSSGEININFVVDTEVSDFSNNAVSNKSIKNYVDERTIDYFVERGTSGGWTYRKTASGDCECWRAIPHTISWLGNSPLYYSTTWLSVNFPVGLFISSPIVTSSFQNEQGAIIHVGTGQVLADKAAFLFSRVYGGSDDVSGLLYVRAVGSWK